MVALLAAILGALIGVIATELARKRREQAAADARLRAAARMVSAEMGMAAIALDSANTSGPWGLAALPTTGWTQHGAQLADALSDDEFYAVADAASKVGAIRSLTEVSHKGPGAIVAQMAGGHVTGQVPFDELARACRHAQGVLNPYAYPNDPDAPATS